MQSVEVRSRLVMEDVPNSAGLRLALSVRPIGSEGGEGSIPLGARSVSVFLVNYRHPAADDVRDQAFAFQAQLEVRFDHPLVPRPDLRSLRSEDWDDRVADLQYRDAFEFAVGHSIATEAEVEEGICQVVRTCWIPEAPVERVAPTPITGVELSMERGPGAADHPRQGPLPRQHSGGHQQPGLPRNAPFGAEARAANPRLKVVLCEPFVKPTGKLNDGIRKRQEIVARLAKKHGAALVHFQRIFDEAAKRAPADYWIWDNVHPTYRGHQLMADEWERVVREVWK